MTTARSHAMELLVLALATYAAWQMTSALPLQPPARMIVAVIGIVLEALYALLALGLVHLH